MKNILENNSRKAEELKREKYNPDDLFKKNPAKQEVVEENTQMIEYKEENVFQKVWNTFKKLFCKLKR